MFGFLSCSVYKVGGPCLRKQKGKKSVRFRTLFVAFSEPNIKVNCSSFADCCATGADSSVSPVCAVVWRAPAAVETVDKSL